MWNIEGESSSMSERWLFLQQIGFWEGPSLFEVVSFTLMVLASTPHLADEFHLDLLNLHQSFPLM